MQDIWRYSRLIYLPNDTKNTSNDVQMVLLTFFLSCFCVLMDPNLKPRQSNMSPIVNLIFQSTNSNYKNLKTNILNLQFHKLKIIYQLKIIIIKFFIQLWPIFYTELLFGNFYDVIARHLSWSRYSFVVDLIWVILLDRGILQ